MRIASGYLTVCLPLDNWIRYNVISRTADLLIAYCITVELWHLGLELRIISC